MEHPFSIIIADHAKYENVVCEIEYGDILAFLITNEREDGTYQLQIDPAAVQGVSGLDIDVILAGIEDALNVYRRLFESPSS